jgi:hypothetical protein
VPKSVGISVSDADTELRESFVRLLRPLDCPRDLPVLGLMADREVLWRPINGAQGAMVHQMPARKSLTRERETGIGEALL